MASGSSRLRLRFEERERISRGLAAGESFRSIGRGLGRDLVAAELNGRPRKTLDWMTPAEKMEELLR